MKRTTKAWAVIVTKTGCISVDADGRPIVEEKKIRARDWLIDHEMAVPCTITWDDGKKAKP